MTVFDEMGGAIVANRDVKIVEFGMYDRRYLIEISDDA